MTTPQTMPESFSPDRAVVGMWLVLTVIPLPIAALVIARQGLHRSQLELLTASLIVPIVVLIFVARFRVTFTADEMVYRRWGPTIRVRYGDVLGIEVTNTTRISGDPIGAFILTKDGRRLPFWPKLFPRRAVVRFLQVSPQRMRCLLCDRDLDVADDPLSTNCGGDCWGCVSEAEVWGTGFDLDEYRRDPAKFISWPTEAATAEDRP